MKSKWWTGIHFKGDILYHQVWLWLAITSRFENLPLLPSQVGGCCCIFFIPLCLFVALQPPTRGRSPGQWWARWWASSSCSSSSSTCWRGEEIMRRRSPTTSSRITCSKAPYIHPYLHQGMLLYLAAPLCYSRTLYNHPQSDLWDNLKTYTFNFYLYLE